MLRKFAVLTSLFIAAAGWATATGVDATVKIMTQNMDEGTGSGYIVAAAFGLMSAPDAVDLTFAELQASRLEQRAGLLAGKIAGQKPDILALQEVALWRIGPTPQTAIIPVYDQLTFLLLELLKRGVPYDIAAISTVEDIALPGKQIKALRLTSRNVLLVRAEFRLPALFLSDVQSHIFATTLDIAGLQVASGWISAKVHLGNKQFLLAAVHLESTIPGYPPATTVQVSQTQELIAALRSTTIPVVICGDFNSDANNPHDPAAQDVTETAGEIQSAGYTEVWHLFHNNPGDTWPLYLDDLIPISFPATTPNERIDLFFSQGIQALDVEQVVAPAPSGFTPPFASDHVGVIATFTP